MPTVLRAAKAVWAWLQPDPPASLLARLYYAMLRRAQWQLAVMLATVSLGVHVIMAYYVTPAVHHTELGALLQALVLFWGGWAYLGSAMFGLIRQVELRQDAVAGAIDGVIELVRLLPAYKVDTTRFQQLWGQVLRHSTPERLRAREHLTEHLEEELHRACFPLSHSDQQLHDLLLEILGQLRTFRQEAFFDLEATNLVRFVLLCTLAAGLGTFLNALEILHRDDSDALAATAAEYWVLAAVLAVLSGWGSSFVLHGNFCLGYSRQRFVRQSDTSLQSATPSSLGPPLRAERRYVAPARVSA